MSLVLLLAAAAIITTFAAGLIVLRYSDARADRREWARLASTQPEAPLRFSPQMVAHLPEPARRYFAFTILPDTPILSVAEIDMTGLFSLGTKEAPRYQNMKARQILALPHGFVWAMRTRSGLPLSGSDTASWTRFRILGLIPVARLGGTPDHSRSAFGRYVAEAVFWTPGALLPRQGVQWEAVGSDTARVTVIHGAMAQSIDVRIDDDGRPTQVQFQRWSNANPLKTFRLQSSVVSFPIFGRFRATAFPFTSRQETCSAVMGTFRSMSPMFTGPGFHTIPGISTHPSHRNERVSSQQLVRKPR